MTNNNKNQRLITRRRVLGMLGLFGGFTYTFLDTTILTGIEKRSVDTPDHQAFFDENPQPERISESMNDLDECPYESNQLLPHVEMNTTFIPTWEEIDDHLKSYEFKKEGGCWSPPDCNPSQKVAIIIPFKNRDEHLRALLYRLHPMLHRQKTAYCIIVTEQEDDGRFNKGAVMNAGFKEAMKMDNFDCVIFHDVDMLPESDFNIYQCQDDPTHLSPLIDKFDYKPYGTDFGGITMLRPNDYIKANGMSNLFWGWGREDDDMQHRIERAELTVVKPKNYDQARYKMIPHQHPWIFRNFKLRDSTTDVRFLPPDFLVKYKERSGVEGVSSVDYQLARTVVEKYFTKIYIELRRLVVKDLKTFSFINNESMQIGDMAQGRKCEYIKLENTKICENYGHTMVLKSLRKKNLSHSDATKMCDELGYMCVGFSEDAPAKFKLREVTQFMSSDMVDSNCNTKGDLTYHKQCTGNPSFVQLNSDIILKSYPTNQNLPFQHQIELEQLVPTRGRIVFRQALLVEGVQIGPIYTRVFSEVGNVLSIDFSLPVPMPGFYTMVSKLTDELGQPLYEWKSTIRVSTGNYDQDKQIRKQTDIYKVFDHYGWDIQNYDEFKSQFSQLYYGNGNL